MPHLNAQGHSNISLGGAEAELPIMSHNQTIAGGWVYICAVWSLSSAEYARR